MWENVGIMATLPIPPAVQMAPRRAVHDQSRAAATTEAAPAGTGPEGARPADCGPPPAGEKQARRTMKVILAQPRGFCAGVVRAIEIVERTLGQIDGPVVLVHSEQDFAALSISPDTPVAYVTQTTLSVDDTRGIIAALERRYQNIVGPEIRDICYATQNRQSAVRELSDHVDVILVVGAKNSSNSNRLREIGAEAGIPSYLIAYGSELDPAWVRDAKTVGITAGASAPEVLVEDVIAALRRLGQVEVSTLPGREETIEFRLPVELTRERDVHQRA